MSARMDDRFLDVDDHGVLKAPASLWLCVAFLLRHWVLILFIAVSASRSPETMGWIDADRPWLMPVIELPTLLLVFAWTRRVPTAGWLARTLWRRGRELITAAAGLDLAWAVWFLSVSTPWNPWPERVVLLLALVDALIILVTWRSVVWRQLFREFPAAPPSKGASP